MTISELVEQLNKIKDEVGDKPVEYKDDDGRYSEVRVVKLRVDPEGPIVYILSYLPYREPPMRISELIDRLNYAKKYAGDKDLRVLNLKLEDIETVLIDNTTGEDVIVLF